MRRSGPPRPRKHSAVIQGVVMPAGALRALGPEKELRKGVKERAAVSAGVDPRRGMSELESTALSRIEHAGLPAPVREHRFAPPRMWRFDLAYLGQMVAVECEGGTWSRGRHTTGKGFDGDCRKYGEAIVRGWRVIRCTRDMIEDGTMVLLLKRALEVT